MLFFALQMPRRGRAYPAQGGPLGREVVITPLPVDRTMKKARKAGGYPSHMPNQEQEEENDPAHNGHRNEESVKTPGLHTIQVLSDLMDLIVG